MEILNIESPDMRCQSLILLILSAVTATAAEAPRFFPSSSHDNSSRIDSDVEAWYARQLTALGERSLCCGEPLSRKVIRFTWLRTFHQPVAIRMEQSTTGAWTLRTKVSGGAGGFNPGSVVIDEQRELSAADADRVLAKITHGSEFWMLPESLPRVQSRSLPDGSVELRITSDGAQWIVEVRDGDDYHFVDRWSPEEGLVREIGLLLMSLSKQEFGSVY